MHIFKKVSSSALLSIAFVNLALADAVPVTCPLPKDIQNPSAQESKVHSLHKIKCMGDACVWEQTNRYGTDFHWHFYIHKKAGSAKDNINLNTQMQEVINSLAYLSGPIEEQPYAFVCRYSNSLNFNALAVYTKEIKCPTPNDIAEQKENGKISCGWGRCTYTLEDRFDSDFLWNFSMPLSAWSESNGENRAYNMLPGLMYGRVGKKPAYNTANPIKEGGNLYVCRYYNSDGFKATATYSSYD